MKMKKDQKSKAYKSSVNSQNSSGSSNGDGSAGHNGNLDSDDSDRENSDNENSDNENQEDNNEDSAETGGRSYMSHARCGHHGGHSNNGPYHSHGAGSHQCSHHSSFSFNSNKNSKSSVSNSSSSSSSSSIPPLVTISANSVASSTSSSSSTPNSNTTMLKSGSGSPSPNTNFILSTANAQYYPENDPQQANYYKLTTNKQTLPPSYPFYPHGSSPNPTTTNNYQAFTNQTSPPPSSTNPIEYSNQASFDASSSSAYPSVTDPSNPAAHHHLMYSQFNSYTYNNPYLNSFYTSPQSNANNYALTNESGYSANSASTYQFAQSDYSAYPAHNPIQGAESSILIENNYNNYLSSIQLAAASTSNTSTQMNKLMNI